MSILRKLSIMEELIAEEDAQFLAYVDLAIKPIEEEQRVRCEELHHQGLCAGLCVPFAQRVTLPKSVQLKEEEPCHG